MILLRSGYDRVIVDTKISAHPPYDGFFFRGSQDTAYWSWRFVLWIWLRNSERNERSLLNCPVIDLVVIRDLGLRTPRIAEHMWVAVATTATPSGSTKVVIVSAICLVIRSWICNRRAYISTIRGIFDSPTTLLSLIHIWRCRRYSLCRSRWSPYH